MFARRQDRIEAQIWAGRDSSLRVSGTVTDISLGGCYMEMLAPLPVDTDLEIVLTPEDTSLRVRARFDHRMQASVWVLPSPP
jgi:hypothetical protein